MEHECGNNRVSSRKLKKKLDIIKMFYMLRIQGTIYLHM
jgi:hypothetical protein